ncbi:replicative DNA helicase [Francisella sp. SYW-2]|uniref:replicative DNA helicase n=1 Tax=Francisella sp. SYW-2 TaxID=2610886 RepID=UPI00123DA169|nr:replicative DNA helicase [Francisella sp. SYW-2]
MKNSLYNIDIERAIISHLMMNNDSYDNIANKLHPIIFFDNRHRVIIEAIIKFAQAGNNYDAILIIEDLKNNDKLDKAGGDDYIINIITNSISIYNINEYLDILQHKKIRRDLSSTLIEFNNLIADMNTDLESNILPLLESKILSIRDNINNKKDDFIRMKDVVPKILNDFEKIASGNQMLGLQTGFTELDKKLGGLREEQLIVVAGRPAMGKTAFVMNIIENILKNTNKSVLLFSMEMAAKDIVQRMFASVGEIPFDNIRQVNFNFDEWGDLIKVKSILERKKLNIIDEPSLTPQGLKHKARKFKRSNKDLGLIVIDYLQLMQCPIYQNNRNLEVSKISNELKALSKELKIPVIVISQLNRAVDSRIDKRPFMSDLRDSGSIEQDADIILFIYRDEVYDSLSKSKGKADIIISKHRNGSIGNISLLFEGNKCKFYNL